MAKHFLFWFPDYKEAIAMARIVAGIYVDFSRQLARAEEHGGKQGKTCDWASACSRALDHFMSRATVHAPGCWASWRLASVPQGHRGAIGIAQSALSAGGISQYGRVLDFV